MADRRAWLIERIIRWFIIPLAGRGVQVVRQDERGSGLHHAPLCGANHYHHTRPITSACTCGAEAEWRDSQAPGPPEEAREESKEGDAHPVASLWRIEEMASEAIRTESALTVEGRALRAVVREARAALTPYVKWPDAHPVDVPRGPWKELHDAAKHLLIGTTTGAFPDQEAECAALNRLRDALNGVNRLEGEKP